MLDWDKLRIFHAAAEAGSFTHAGDTLGMSQSSVSRQVSALEDDLKIKLFIRHARGLVLSEAGEALFKTAHRMAWELQTVEARMSASRDNPTGPLIVTTTIGFGSTWLTSRISQFLEQYPSIQLEIKLNDSEMDLAMRSADVAIRLHRPNQSDLIQRRILTVHFHIYATQKYLDEHGVPDSIDDLDNHRIISFGSPPPAYLGDINFLEMAGRPEKHPRIPVLRVNSIYGIMRAARQDIGLAMLPDYITERDSSLVRVLPEVTLPEFETYFVYPPEMRDSRRVQVFRDFLVANAKEWKY